MLLMTVPGVVAVRIDNGMRNCSVRENRTMNSVKLITCVIVLAVAFTVTPQLWAQAGR